MSDSQVQIPKYAGAGVAFAGVEIKDCFILLGAALMGFICGAFLDLGLKGYVGIPAIGYFVNAWYLEWKEDAAPGHFRAVLYRHGIVGYSRAFPSANVVYVGDSKPLNPASRGLIQARRNAGAAARKEV
jgi:hypothetical protein